MSRFIKVTTHPEKNPLFLRWDFVELVSVNEKGGSYLQLSNESHSQFAIVSETPEEVAAMIEIESAAEWGAPATWSKPLETLTKESKTT